MTHTVYLPLVSNQPPTLKSAFGNHGIQFGFAVNDGSFQNDVVRKLIAQHANIVTTENALKMMYTQPKRGVFDFSAGDRIVEYAHELGIDVHGHTASWAWQNPSWLHGTFSRNELASILGEHVETMGWHYKDKLVSLDVANEAYAGAGGSLMAGPWDKLDDFYVSISYNSARVASCFVLYNCFSKFECPNPEHDKALKLLDDGIADGIGIQLHLYENTYDEALDTTETFLKLIRAYGGWCRFSEVGVLASCDEAQAVIYQSITSLAIKYQDIVKGFIVWGVRDPAWRGNVTLFDSDGDPKLGYDAVMEECAKG